MNKTHNEMNVRMYTRSNYFSVSINGRRKETYLQNEWNDENKKLRKVYL